MLTCLRKPKLPAKAAVTKLSRSGRVVQQFCPSSWALTFGVYNGQKHIPVNVTEDMIGQKFGEYSPTRTYYGHAADKKAKRK